MGRCKYRIGYKNKYWHDLGNCETEGHIPSIPVPNLNRNEVYREEFSDSHIDILEGNDFESIGYRDSQDTFKFIDATGSSTEESLSFHKKLPLQEERELQSDYIRLVPSSGNKQLRNKRHMARSLDNLHSYNYNHNKQIQINTVVPVASQVSRGTNNEKNINWKRKKKKPQQSQQNSSTGELDDTISVDSKINNWVERSEMDEDALEDETSIHLFHPRHKSAMEHAMNLGVQQLSQNGSTGLDNEEINEFWSSEDNGRNTKANLEGSILVPKNNNDVIMLEKENIEMEEQRDNTSRGKRKSKRDCVGKNSVRSGSNDRGSISAKPPLRSTLAVRALQNESIKQHPEIAGHTSRRTSLQDMKGRKRGKRAASVDGQMSINGSRSSRSRSIREFFFGSKFSEKQDIKAKKNRAPLGGIKFAQQKDVFSPLVSNIEQAGSKLLSQNELESISRHLKNYLDGGSVIALVNYSLALLDSEEKMKLCPLIREVVAEADYMIFDDAVNSQINRLAKQKAMFQKFEASSRETRQGSLSDEGSAKHISHRDIRVKRKAPLPPSSSQHSSNCSSNDSDISFNERASRKQHHQSMSSLISIENSSGNLEQKTYNRRHVSDHHHNEKHIQNARTTLTNPSNSKFDNNATSFQYVKPQEHPYNTNNKQDVQRSRKHSKSSTYSSKSRAPLPPSQTASLTFEPHTKPKSKKMIPNQNSTYTDPASSSEENDGSVIVIKSYKIMEKDGSFKDNSSDRKEKLSKGSELSSTEYRNDSMSSKESANSIYINPKYVTPNKLVENDQSFTATTTQQDSTRKKKKSSSVHSQDTDSSQASIHEIGEAKNNLMAELQSHLIQVKDKLENHQSEMKVDRTKQEMPEIDYMESTAIFTSLEKDNKTFKGNVENNQTDSIVQATNALAFLDSFDVSDSQLDLSSIAHSQSDIPHHIETDVSRSQSTLSKNSYFRESVRSDISTATNRYGSYDVNPQLDENMNNTNQVEKTFLYANHSSSSFPNQKTQVSSEHNQKQLNLNSLRENLSKSRAPPIFIAPPPPNEPPCNQDLCTSDCETSEIHASKHWSEQYLSSEEESNSAAIRKPTIIRYTDSDFIQNSRRPDVEENFHLQNKVKEVLNNSGGDESWLSVESTASGEICSKNTIYRSTGRKCLEGSSVKAEETRIKQSEVELSIPNSNTKMNDEANTDLDVKVVYLDKSFKTMGMSISGGTDYKAQPEIKIKAIAAGGAAEAEGSVQIGQQIVDVDGSSLIGVTHMQAVVTIKKSFDNKIEPFMKMMLK